MMPSKSIDVALLLLRLTFGSLMIINHGWGKLMKLFGEGPIEFSNPVGFGEPASLALAAFAEGVCSVFVIVGLFTRWALAPLIITMLVAIFFVHWTDPFKRMEMALLYLTVFTGLWLTGPGWYSLDAQWRKP